MPNTGDWLYPVGICVVYLNLIFLLKMLSMTAISNSLKSLLVFSMLMTLLQDIYNIIILFAHIILGILLMWSAIQNDYNVSCQPIYSIENDWTPSLVYSYYILKIFQLGEIILPFLNVNNFLMLFHRLSMVLMAWYAAMYAPGGSVIIWMILDCLVFVVILVIRPRHAPFYALNIFDRGTNPSKFHEYEIRIAIVTFTVLISLYATFFSCIVVLWKDCGFPHEVAEAVIVYLLVLFDMKILEPYYYTPPIPGPEPVNTYTFWTIPYENILSFLGFRDP